MEASWAAICKFGFLCEPLAHNVPVKVWGDIKFFVGECHRVRLLVVTTLKVFGCVAATIRLECKTLLFCWNVAQVSCKVKQVYLVNMVGHSLTARVFAAQTCDMPPEVREETNFILAFVTLCCCSHHLFGLKDDLLLFDCVAWAVRLFGPAFFVFHISEYFLVLFVGSLMWPENELQVLAFLSVTLVAFCVADILSSSAPWRPLGILLKALLLLVVACCLSQRNLAALLEVVHECLRAYLIDLLLLVVRLVRWIWV